MKTLLASSTLFFLSLVGCGKTAPSVSETKSDWQPAFYYCGPVHDPAHCESLHDGTFEQDTSPNIADNHLYETLGPDAKGVDINAGLAFEGRNNAWIRGSSRQWNALKQDVTVQLGQRLRLSGWIRTSPNVHDG